jgi:Spy/CpxP family protein refolding chaperone
MKKLFIASALVAAVSVCGLAAAKSASHEMRHHQPIKMMIKHLRGLSLTETQRDEIKTLVSNFRSANPRPSFDDIEREGFAFATATEAELIEFVTEKMTAKEDKFFALAQLRHNIFNVLTPEQQTLMLEKEAKREAKREARRDARFAKGGERMRGHHGPFKGLDLTDEQKAELVALKEEAKVAMQSHRETMQNFKDAQQTLIRSDAFSEDAFDALVAQYKDDLVSAGVEKAKHRQAMFAVLTDEQQALLKAKRTEERELREIFRPN